MDITKNGYCRLCATLFPNEKLINLLTDTNKLDDVVRKLVHLNAKVDISGNILPKTICLTCNSSLDAAYQFILVIEQAQYMLTGIILQQNIKVENVDSGDDGDFYDLKQEDYTVKAEPVDSKPVSVKKEAAKKRKEKLLIKHSSTESYTETSSLENNWKGYNWICSFCETQFTTFKELNTHSVEFHNSCNAYRCSDCGIRKLKLDRFVKHVKCHRKYLKLCCYLCHKDCDNIHELNYHVTTHLESNYKCEGCNSTFIDKDELNKHLDTLFKIRRVKAGEALDKMRDNLTCLICNKTYRYKSSLHTHLQTHAPRKKDHTCEKCGKCFYSLQNLLAHIASHENIKPFKCEICKTGFRTGQQLRNHVKIIHDNKKPFACEQCGKCFRLQKNLTSHSRVHNDELPFVCSYCSKAFRFKNLLNQHIRQHTGEKPYSCAACKHDFTNWPNYNKHMKRRHNVDTSKTKRTENGVFKIDPATGELINFTVTNELLQWKESVMTVKRKRTELATNSKVVEPIITEDNG